MKVGLVTELTNHKKEINCVAFGRDYLATCSGDKTIGVYNIGHEFKPIPVSPLAGHLYTVQCCAFSPVDDLLASCSVDGRCVLWHLKSGAETQTFSHMGNSDLRVCCFSPDGRLLATGSNDETLCIWDISKRAVLMRSGPHEAAVVALAFSPDGAFIVSGTPSGDLRVWDAVYANTRPLLKEHCAHDLGIAAVNFSPAHNDVSSKQSKFTLASCGADNLAKLWLMTFTPSKRASVTLTLTYRLAAHEGPVVACSFSPDGVLLATASVDKTVKLWDVIKGQLNFSFVAHDYLLTSCAFSRDGRYLATASVDKTARVWYANTGSGEASSPAGAMATAAASVARQPAPSPQVEEWSVGVVCHWIGQLLPANHQHYVDEFRRCQVDGKYLLTLNNDVLANRLNIDSVQARNKILHNVHILRSVHSVRGTPDGQSLPETVNGVPYEFLCPITLEPLREPVIAADGFTYEGEAIRSWLANGNGRSPMTNEKLPHADLLPNHSLRIVIERFGGNK